MGFIKAFSGAIGGTLADLWKDYYIPNPNISATSGVFKGVLSGTNAGRGSNTKGSNNIITNGSKIVVPEGTCLVTVQDGLFTGCICEAGGYEFRSNDPNSQSLFAGDGFMAGIIKQSFERFKFGGIPASQQLVFYVNLKEIPNNRFGTQSEIYWDDAFFGTQVGALVRGVYTLRIVDPLLFLKGFVPIKYLQPNAPNFDFSDMDNPSSEQLFTEVVGSLSAAFSIYTNDASRNNRMSKIQSDQVGFAKSLSEAVNENYAWKNDRGLEIVKVAIAAIEYDEDTKTLMKDVKKADALSGNRGNSFMQQAVARGIQAAGENGGGMGMAFMGMGMNAVGGMMQQTQQAPMPNTYQQNFAGYMQNGYPNPNVQMQGAYPNTPTQDGYQNGQMQGQQVQQVQQSAQDPTQKLIDAKKLLDAGVISQEEFDKMKSDILGI